MRLPMMITAFGAVLAASAAHAASPSVEIKDAVARVTVIPEARSDIKVEILASHPQLPLQVRTAGDKVIIDGDLDRKIRSCDGEGDRARASVAGLGHIAYADMPQVVIRTPRHVDIAAGAAVFGVIGRSDSLKLSNAGCGDWTAANVAGPLKVNMAGSGDARVGSAAEATLRAAGSGDISAQAVSGPLNVDIAGSGDVRVASVDGSLDVKIAGSGDVKVEGGRGGATTVSIAGSGGMVFGGVADSLKARIAGSGDVRVKAVTGEVSKAVIGSGEVKIG